MILKFNITLLSRALIYHRIFQYDLDFVLFEEGNMLLSTQRGCLYGLGSLPATVQSYPDQFDALGKPYS